MIVKNMKNKIYIIGNGFDMHHSLNTAYFKYKMYLKSINKRLVEKLDRLMEEHGIEPDGIKYWSKLEDYLCVISQFDIDEVYDASLSSTESDIGRASYWSDPGYNAKTYSKEITDVVKGVKNHFDGWIQEIEKSISIENTSIKIDLELPIDAYYLNFNYTSTLEKLYSIPSQNVLHIHGSIKDDYILGHNQKLIIPFEHPEMMKMDWKGDPIYGDDFRCVEIKKSINNAYREIYDVYYKNSKSIIQKNKDFFNKFINADEIIFMGLSMGEQDWPYIEEIAKLINNNCIVKVYYHNEEEDSVPEDMENSCECFFNKSLLKYENW